MPHDPRLVYWDSCVFISYFEAVPERMVVLEGILARSAERDDRFQIVTSTFTIAEVVLVARPRGKPVLSDTTFELMDELWEDPAVRLIEFHPAIAREARRLIRRANELGRRFKPADAVHLASAVWVGAAELNSYDKKLCNASRRLAQIPAHEPQLGQGELFARGSEGP